jgi:hypothetical protein
MRPKRSLRKKLNTSDWDATDEAGESSAVTNTATSEKCLNFSRLSFRDEELLLDDDKVLPEHRPAKSSCDTPLATDKVSDAASKTRADTDTASAPTTAPTVVDNIHLHQVIKDAALVPVTLKSQPSRGRMLVAETKIAPSTIILAEMPYAAVLTDTQIHLRCSHCFVAGKSLRRCAGCHKLHYCSKAGCFTC